tara:strand:- start:12129 stop:12344 length:216 start_codon:yes stop_codon:yes gene_type:complete
VDLVQFAQTLYKRINVRQDDISTYLTSGAAQDYETYRSLVGELQGLTFIREEMKTLLENSEDDVESIFIDT